tara:strand:+ start:398 stop:670 length:273 start_codon:yes stop_codon:yes gene_type:complete
MKKMAKDVAMQKKARKAKYERERYKRNKKKILAQQAKYYKANHLSIRLRRVEYTDEYNKVHSVRFGDAKFRKKGSFKGRTKKYNFDEHKT